MVSDRGKSRFGNPLGDRKNGRGFVGEGSWRAGPRSGGHTYVADLIAMPHNEHAPACKITNDLIQMRVWEVIESGARLKISCDNCHHESTWTSGYMEKRLRKWKGKTMGTMAVRLRCGGCRSNYVRVWRG